MLDRFGAKKTRGIIASAGDCKNTPSVAFTNQTKVSFLMFIRGYLVWLKAALFCRTRQFRQGCVPLFVLFYFDLGFLFIGQLCHAFPVLYLFVAMNL